MLSVDAYFSSLFLSTLSADDLNNHPFPYSRKLFLNFQWNPQLIIFLTTKIYNFTALNASQE